MRNDTLMSERRPVSAQTLLRQRITAVFLGGIAFVVMLLVSLPLLPAAAYLKYEPSGAVLLLAGCLLGPIGGLLACATKDFLFFAAGIGNIFGVVSDFLALLSFLLPVWLLLRRTKGFGGRLAAYLTGTLASMLLMIPVNLVILQLEFGMSPSHIMGMMLPAILPFNAIKCLLNALLYELGGRRLTNALSSYTHL